MLRLFCSLKLLKNRFSTLLSLLKLFAILKPDVLSVINDNNGHDLIYFLATGAKRGRGRFFLHDYMYFGLLILLYARQLFLAGVEWVDLGIIARHAALLLLCLFVGLNQASLCFSTFPLLLGLSYSVIRSKTPFKASFLRVLVLHVLKSIAVDAVALLILVDHHSMWLGSSSGAKAIVVLSFVLVKVTVGESV